jgi:hypothetical protein
VKSYYKGPQESASQVVFRPKTTNPGFFGYSLREIIACKAEISLRGPEATKTGASENASGDRAKKSVERSRSAGAGPLSYGH